MLFLLAEATATEAGENIEEILYVQIIPAVIAVIAIVIVICVYANRYCKFKSKFKEDIFKNIDDETAQSYEQGIRAFNKVYGHRETDETR